MIPKKIHYCWFGGNPLPEDAKKYIESWKKYCPDYEIIEWNESNFDINSNIYVKEAYESKKWAFVTDYVRLYAMYNYGGIYMDTDVEVLKPLDPFLKHEAFSGFETSDYIPTGIMACKKHFDLFKELLDYYNDRHFILKNGQFDTTTNVITITNICKKYGLKPNNTYQEVRGFALYPNDYFCPKSHVTGEIKTTDNTVTIHHFAGSWLTERDKKNVKRQQKLCEKYGKFGNVIYAIISFPGNFATKIKEIGFLKTIGYCFKKIFRRK